ncbi:MAG TPA: hypothetical protein PLJ27_18060 [Polyangiaceae bacterium]|jgi:Mn-dependent DtxR family transcriptional regulator|nr:hypothetical protein [Polyangiaceae bacterium]HNZ24568.1 hypothetical protein [Polyangiaceae bacterium]HOD25678.1 hypothetical protein [Polyangiaceae bacterium]HOE51590.1 hypothetical protein [Polyangiaceae bacterium]HOH01066.1 hypothetical protein [Polyangiaceae bacterium]
MTPQKLAPYILRTLARHQQEGRGANLDTLVQELGVRRADVRQTVSALHREGYVDALRMRLTLLGFAIGTALSPMNLPPLRTRRGIVAAA